MFSLENIKDEVFRLLGIDSLIRSLSDYVEARVELVKMEVRDEISRHLSRFFVVLLTLLLFFMAFGFLSITAGLYLNEILESSWQGFLMVGIGYLVLAILILLFREHLTRSVQGKMKDRMSRPSGSK